MGILKFIRQNENKVFEFMIYYIFGPAMLFQALFILFSKHPLSIIELISIGRYSDGFEVYLTPATVGIVGLTLTIRGIIRLFKR